jgi:hypothetical protein
MYFQKNALDVYDTCLLQRYIQDTHHVHFTFCTPPQGLSADLLSYLRASGRQQRSSYVDLWASPAHCNTLSMEFIHYGVLANGYCVFYETLSFGYLHGYMERRQATMRRLTLLLLLPK